MNTLLLTRSILLNLFFVYSGFISNLSFNSSHVPFFFILLSFLFFNFPVNKLSSFCWWVKKENDHIISAEATNCIVSTWSTKSIKLWKNSDMNTNIFTGNIQQEVLQCYTGNKLGSLKIFYYKVRSLWNDGTRQEQC